MTNTEIKKIVNNHLGEIVSKGFKLQKDILFKEPLDDMLIGFCFEKSGFDKDIFYVNAFVQPLYIENENIILTFGWRIRKQWKLKNNDNLDKDLQELSTLMLEELNSFLNIVDTPSKFYEYYHDKCVNIRMIEAVVYSAIYTKHPDAELILNNFIEILQNENLSIKWMKKILNEMIDLKETFHNDAEISKKLQSNIQKTKSHLKL